MATLVPEDAEVLGDIGVASQLDSGIQEELLVEQALQPFTHKLSHIPFFQVLLI